MGVRPSAPASIGIGFDGGLVGIASCVSPIALYLLGIASATEAFSLGNRPYGDYAWYFRAAGVAVGGLAFTLYLRRRGQCDVAGARRQLYGFTTWLGERARG